MTKPNDQTQRLASVRAGSRQAFDELFDVAYDELKRAAHYRLAHRLPGETLCTTALVHEAYVRLIDQSRAAWVDRAHFLALASRAMRFVLIDHARARSARKRGPEGAVRVALDDIELASDAPPSDLLALHDALERLAGWSPRLAQVVEYRFFGGLTYEEVAEVTGTSVPTAKRDWVRARAWLHAVMAEDADAAERTLDEPGLSGPEEKHA
jgi:RNA polymerase sigma factor (TIGR02999 family)